MRAFVSSFGQLLDSGRSAASRLLAALHMAEGAAENVVDGDGEDERGAGHGKGEVVGVVDARAEVLLCPLHDLHGCRRSKEGTDVDGHVEDGEARVALVRHTAGRCRGRPPSPGGCP